MFSIAFRDICLYTLPSLDYFSFLLIQSLFSIGFPPFSALISSITSRGTRSISLLLSKPLFLSFPGHPSIASVFLNSFFYPSFRSLPSLPPYVLRPRCHQLPTALCSFPFEHLHKMGRSTLNLNQFASKSPRHIGKHYSYPESPSSPFGTPSLTITPCKGWSVLNSKQSPSGATRRA